MKQKWTGERLETFVLNELTIEHLHRYALVMNLSEGKNVLDIACGEGYGVNLIASKAAHVCGMDVDKSVIEKAKKKYNKANISFNESNAEQIAAGASEFDLVSSFETLEHLSGQELMLKEIKRVLKPGGLLIISTPNRNIYTEQRNYNNPFHKKELDHQEFVSLLKSVFSYVRVYDQRMIHSSLIYSPSSAGLDIYSGDFLKIKKNKSANPVYFIALASNDLLPELPNSLFTCNSILEQMLTEKERMVKNLFTYKLGHFILYPFKLIRKYFKK